MILAAERQRLAPLLPPHELLLTGGTSVATALTKGDVLAPAGRRLGFSGNCGDAAATLRRRASTHRTDTLATFSVPAPLPTGVAVTPIGSEHDIRFVTTWQLLSSRPDLLAEYNTMKRTAGADYETRKLVFFDRIVKDAERP